MIIELGEIIKAQGIRGEVKVKPLVRDSSLFKTLRVLTVDGIPFKAESVSVRNGFVYCLFSGVNDRNRAEMLVGKKIRTDTDLLPPLKEGEYYIADLLGKDLYLSDGTYAGKVLSVENYGSADIITVSGERTVRFPFLKKLGLVFDSGSGRITVDSGSFQEVAVYED